MEASLICGSNALFENFAAFAVFGIVGYLPRWPQYGVRLGAFVGAFLTPPIMSVIVSKAPVTNAAGFWKRIGYLSRFCYSAFYSVMISGSTSCVRC